MKDWKTNGRFAAGVLAGAAAAVVIICGIFGMWKVIPEIRGKDYTSADISEADVDDKLDQISSLIDSYYLYDDEIDIYGLIDGI